MSKLWTRNVITHMEEEIEANTTLWLHLRVPEVELDEQGRELLQKCTEYKVSEKEIEEVESVK